MREGARDAINLAIVKARQLAQEHPVELGVIEMGMGAALLAVGVNTGLILVGTDVVASALPSFGAAGGAALGVIAAKYIGSIGVAAMGTAIAVPASILTVGAATVFASFGVNAGNLLESLLTPSWTSYVQPGAMALVGIALFIDGARRVIGDENLSQMKAAVTDACIELGNATVEVIATTLEQLRAVAPRDLSDPKSGTLITAASVAIGAGAGSSIAASTVTVLGSKALGAAALSMGLVSAPVWPVIAGGAAAGAVGYALWKSSTKFRKSK
ncbi:hypothetical protein ASE28_17400 [Acidovorax sp. Root219]|nr:hypothetical protein ASE28_17400 [Acidovorax sp. Root219]